MKELRAGLASPTGRGVALPVIWPNVGVRVWYQTQLEELVHQMYLDSRRELIPAVEDVPPILVQDSTAPTAAGVIFRHRGRILIMQRTDAMRWWGVPGGKIDGTESPTQAARREVWEETGHAYGGPLDLLHMHRYRHTYFATFVANLSEPFTPELNDEHTRYAWVDIPTALARFDLHPGLRLALERLNQGDRFAQDAAPTKELQLSLERWGKEWEKKFSLMSKNIADEFAKKNGAATTAAMHSRFHQAGFTVPFKPTRKSLEVYRTIAAEQVGLIKSIAQKYHTDVQTAIWETVRTGSDLKALSEKLEKTYGVTRRRAALIALDQNDKAKETIENARLDELGVKEGIWMHSHAGKKPRPTHVKMNGKRYILSRGMWDEAEQKYVQAGELINCRCSKRIYIPGFEEKPVPYGPRGPL